jgi:predicted dehydrogenase
MKRENSKKERSGISRRRFLQGAAAVAAFTYVPKRVLGENGQPSAIEKLNIAGIGVGGQGSSDIDQFAGENIVALCDVDEQHAAHVFNRYPNAKKYTDFRQMLDEMKEIDAVVVATPDHLHATVSLRAMRMGKHVYCEKPLTHTVEEARLMAATAREAKVATQMGNQGQASEETRRLCEMIWDGAIGPVREVHIWTDRPIQGLFNWYWPQGVDRPSDTPAVPATMDWDLWLGPAPVRPYHPAYAPFRWRGWWDFGTGALGDIGCHSMDAIFRALKLGHPANIEATSTLVNDETYPAASMVHYEFPARGDMPPVQLTWYDGGLKPPRPAELEPGREMPSNGAIYIGDKGKMFGSRIIPESKMQEYSPPPLSLPRSVGHYQEWVEACKGGQPAGSNFEHAGSLTEMVLLGNIALRRSLKEKLTKVKLDWDGTNMTFPNMPEADVFLRRENRAGWNL